jgi:hydroxypyruvate isomerase
MASLTRRSLLKGAAAAPLAGAASLGASLQAAGQTPASKFTLSVNLELMYPRQMPYAERSAVTADQGCTAFSFWELPPNQAAALEGAQRRYGLKCGSITGSGKTGWSTGLTRTGFESAFLEDFKDHIEVAKRFNVKNLVCFLGVTQKEISLAVQHAQVIEGLKKVGDIAARNDVYFCLEPLSIVPHPEMSVHTAQHGFRIVQEVHHPHVRLDYDVFHVQLSEGNIINNLREGLRKRVRQTMRTSSRLFARRDSRTSSAWSTEPARLPNTPSASSRAWRAFSVGVRVARVFCRYSISRSALDGVCSG